MKKLWFVLVASLLLVTACSKSGGEGNEGGASGSPSASQSADSPDNKEPVTLKIVNKDMPPDDPNTIKLVKAIEEGMAKQGTPIKLEIVPVQAGTYSEKLGLLLQGGNIPDLIYFQGGDYNFAVNQKILEDLTPYIEKSTYLKASLSELNKERMKSYPYLVWAAPIRAQVPVVRQDWFDKTASGKALLENPTVDNYYNFFKELKQVSGAKYVYTVAGLLPEIDVMFNQAFGLTSTWVKGADGKYVFASTTQAEKDKLDFYAKLYKEGLLDPEFLTKKWDTKEKAFYDGEAAIIAGTQGKIIDIYNTKTVGQNGESAKIMVLPPAKGAAQGYLPVDVSKESRGMAIASTSENKDQAFAVLEYMASPEGQMLDKLGIQGEEYQITNGKIKLTDKFAAWFPHFVENLENFKPAQEFDPSTPYLSEPAVKSMEMFTGMSTKDNAFVMPAELAGKWDASLAVYNEFAANYVVGKVKSEDFAKFVESWNAAGGKEVADYANTVLK
ncbi:ABC transporter substrate-binding protein [Paenibacillus darwinianus]|uniref:ABC transporter substrate-binding protein n=1 Tax=Paenibacillus darwinianus TaxID=1380763 RepID=A0A9W5S2P5_9BACL|nr:extracellular solute-binding protein [Paenibacillus darwinianus]EXX90683.1 ABC transporter substrate-binding protein [Paenibacillus darwinianus]EXX91555.1 ABC transporter substrate-binding protein [Paenibacillus darwinianus]EXX92072.1 ABC transporter substrate-binding protein [Paenibacillus darwinianus]